MYTCVYTYIYIYSLYFSDLSLEYKLCEGMDRVLFVAASPVPKKVLSI